MDAKKKKRIKATLHSFGIIDEISFADNEMMYSLQPLNEKYIRLSNSEKNAKRCYAILFFLFFFCIINTLLSSALTPPPVCRLTFN